MNTFKNKVLVELFYDIISPYGWITFEALSRYNKVFSNMELCFRPVLLGAIMQRTGQQAPIPARTKYTAEDLPNMCGYFNLVFRRPQNVREIVFVKGSLKAQRLLTAVLEFCPQQTEDISRELYQRVWSRHQDVSSAAGLKQACIDAGIQCSDAQILLEKTQDPSVKASLRKCTEAALSYGAFGVPTYVVHLNDGPKMLFGSDRLFLLTHYLNQDYPGPLNELSK